MAAAIGFSRFDAYFNRHDMGVGGLDGKALVEVGIEDTEGCNELLGAGNSTWLAGVFFIENASVDHIDDNNARGGDFWRGG